MTHGTSHTIVRMLESNRRGFLGTLAGLVLGGRVIGPKLLAEPTAKTWESIPPAEPPAKEWQPVHWLPDPVETFLPIEVFVSLVSQAMGPEVGWLRREQSILDEPWAADALRSCCYGRYGAGLGQPLYIRERARLYVGDHGLPERPEMIREHLIAITEGHHVHWEPRGYEMDQAWPPPQFGCLSERWVEPCARDLARQIVDLDRMRKGSDYLVSLVQGAPAGAKRVVNARDWQAKLALRVIESWDFRIGQPRISVDMLIGFGDRRAA
jgi:hypothetical protein